MIKTQATDIVDALRFASRAVGGDAPFMLCSLDDAAHIVATSGQVWCRYAFEGSADGDMIALPSMRKMQQLLEGCVGEVGLSKKGDFVHVEASIKAKLTTFQFFPEMFDMPKLDGAWHPLPQGVERITYATSKLYESLFITPRGLICADGFRLGIIEHTDIVEPSVAVRADMIARVEMDEICSCNMRIGLRSERSILIMPTVSEQLPTVVEQMLDGSVLVKQGGCRVERAPLVRLCSAISILSSVGNASPLNLVLDGDAMQVVAHGSQMGTGDASMQIKEQEGAFDVWAEAGYLTQALNKCQGDDVELSLAHYQTRPFIHIRDGLVRHMILPMVIK